MKGKNERGEGKKERRGGEKERGEKEREKRKGEGKKVPQQGSNLRPSTVQPTAYSYRLRYNCTHERTKPTYIANLDCHELRVASLAALAPPNRHKF